MKKEKSDIKAIVFDIGGVMASEKNLRDHYVLLCKVLKINKNKFFVLRNKYIGKASSGKISGKKFISILANELGIDYSKLLKNWIKFKKKSIKKNFELERAIKRLKKNGYKVGSLSGVLDLHQKLNNEKHLYDVFQFNIYSFKAGYSKPDIRLYHLLIKKLKLNPYEVIVVDDMKMCLDSAKKLGINTILFRDNNQLVKALKKFGVKI
jgi:epoxide hydrolase-like predicted phosphatase